MQIIRQVGIYSLLIKNIKSTLKYYIDNEDDVSEYMDMYQINPLLLYSDREFEEFCLELFS